MKSFTDWFKRIMPTFRFEPVELEAVIAVKSAVEIGNNFHLAAETGTQDVADAFVDFPAVVPGFDAKYLAQRQPLAVVL